MPVYRLPFKTIEGETVSPETDDKASYGFYLPGETRILASRSGKVVEVNRSERTPPNLDVLHRTNYVTVRHSDSTRARYTHVRPAVQVGASVKTGDLLGELYGYSKDIDPHLHFDSYKFDRRRRKIPVIVEFTPF